MVHEEVFKEQRRARYDLRRPSDSGDRNEQRADERDRSLGCR